MRWVLILLDAYLVVCFNWIHLNRNMKRRTRVNLFNLLLKFWESVKLLLKFSDVGVLMMLLKPDLERFIKQLEMISIFSYPHFSMILALNKIASTPENRGRRLRKVELRPSWVSMHLSFRVLVEWRNSGLAARSHKMPNKCNSCCSWQNQLQPIND